ncbi:hypothetical protein C8R46DRAFT_1144898 [Mycena filopes]|nr:hypothetical protein C8R46DRAFT_1144898 [Mycena filopes]
MEDIVPSIVETPTFTRADGLWFEDCGLIIQAETTLFRVSRDVLAIQSPIFRDMFSLPPPKDADMMYGCPYVLLHDSAEDVNSLLRAIFYYDFFEPYPAATTLSVLRGILRLTHKYEIDGLRKRALTHISALHPTTLDQWDAPDLLPRYNNVLSGWDALDIVSLGRELSLDWILPAAFYRACEFSWEDAIITAPISLSDKVLIVSACRLLEGPGVTKILSFLWPDDVMERCALDRFGCRQQAEQWRDRTTDNPAQMPLDIWVEKDWGPLNVCEDCLDDMKADLKAKRQALWDELPGMFGLPAWSELEAMKARAMA